jgi:predicted ATPase/class 3 adenylate cyclase
LFCDVTGSTAFAEDLDPEEWAEIMNEAFEYMIQPVSKYDGTVARLMGDGILAFFGAPIAHEDDPQRAILAGLDILDGIQEFRQKLSDEYHLDFNVRVGVNTGPVVVGDVGTDSAGEYTAMGDAVNLAARMEHTASPGTVQISEDTRQLVAPLFDLESLGEVEIRGKSEPVVSYRVLRRAAAPGRLRGIEGLNAPLIGRSAEFEVLRSRLVQAREGRGGIVSIIGEAGLGKSRLLEELRAEWGSDSTWVVSRGVSYDSSRPYALFHQRILQVFKIEDSDPPSVIREKIAEAPAGYPPQLHTSLARAIETMVAIENDAGASQLQGQEVKEQVFDACHQMWEAAASHSPIVMVIDDLQWSDTASTEVLIDLLSLVEQVPLLILCAFRPERQSPAWRLKQAAEADYPHVYTEVTLDPLSDGDVNELLNGLLAIADLPEEGRQIILEKTDGNPFFVEEMIRTLIDGGAVVRDEDAGVWRAVKDIELITIPDNLQALIISRVDRLDDDARRAIQMASVVGRHFQSSILGSIWDSEAPIDNQLNTLQRAGLIVETVRLPEREYTFKHDLTRDAVYASVLRRRCRQFHGMVGNAIEILFSERVEEHAHRLAYHFGEAADNERALKYSAMAGDQALRMYASHEAVSHYSRAIEIAGTLDTSPALLTSLQERKAAALQGS